jgi:Fur family peroxide stress response transcriptional regulator
LTSLRIESSRCGTDKEIETIFKYIDIFCFLQHIVIYEFDQRLSGTGFEHVEEAAKKTRLEDFKRLCRERGERCTVQRRVIFETVLDLDNHPSADQVYDAVEAHLHGISRTTVYRALEHLAHMGVITKACHPGPVARYDPRLELHHHLVCLHCNQFVDFEDEMLNGLSIPDTSASGFEVRDYRVQLRGICKSCLAKEKEEEEK